MTRAEFERVPTHLLREAVATAIERDTFRAISKETGVSPMGLHRLLNGSEPQQRTRQKLEAWYVRDAARGGAEVPVQAAAAALRLLALGLPPSQRSAAVEQIVAAWTSVYEAARVPLPDWLRQIRGHDIGSEAPVGPDT